MRTLILLLVPFIAMLALNLIEKISNWIKKDKWEF